MFKSISVGLTSVALLTPLSASAVTYTSQQRLVSAYGVGLSPDTAEAQDFGDFNAAVGSYYWPFREFEIVNGLELSYNTTASQTSTLTATSIDVSGSIDGGDAWVTYSAPTARVQYIGAAKAVHTITFAVDVPTHYTLDATWFHGASDAGADLIQYDEPGKIAYIDFSGPGVHHRSEYARDSVIHPAMTYTLNADGVLQPGEYTLDIYFEWVTQPYGLYGEPTVPMTYDAAMTFSTVPAASTSTAMLVGLVAVAKRKRR